MMMKKVCVLGLGETGLSMVKWAVGQGHACTVIDSRQNPPMLAAMQKDFPEVSFCCQPLEEQFLSQFDVLSVSPGISAYHPAILAAKEAGTHVVGDIELFAQKIEALAKKGCSKPKIVAITGSNGKTTVTTLVGEIAKAAGKITQVAGNISPAVLDAVDNTLAKGIYPEVWVLELSSFQLETTETLAPDSAVILNISEDHLDRYDGMDGYIAAKQRIFKHTQVAIVNRDEPRELVLDVKARVSYGLDCPGEMQFGIIRKDGNEWLAYGQQALMPVSDMKLVGKHNVSNLLAAFALTHTIGLGFDAMIHVGKTFAGLPHRVEFVCEINDIKFYDDSKGTNVGATEAALKGAASPVVLIAGGQGKGQDFSPLRQVLNKARAVILIGEDAQQIAKVMTGTDIPVLFCDTLESAVEEAYRQAKSGDMVLLSPACASFDMFKSYVDRAQVFVAAAKALKAKIDASISSRT